MHQAFLYISQPSLHDYNVKVPNFTFCRGREHKTTTFLSFSWTLIQFFRIRLQNKLPTFDELKWRFRSRRCCLSSLLPPDNGQFFQQPTKKSRMVVKFDPYGALVINRGNRILIAIHLYCCSKHINRLRYLSRMLRALLVLSRQHFNSKQYWSFLCILSLCIGLDYHYGIQ